jgi:hypothetical protein
MKPLQIRHQNFNLQYIIVGKGTFFSSVGSGQVNTNMDMESYQLLLTGLGTRYLHLGQS